MNKETGSETMRQHMRWDVKLKQSLDGVRMDSLLFPNT
jgi:hypothetical protein